MHTMLALVACALTAATRPDSRLTVRVGTVFWAMVPLPREALPGPGRCAVRASLCGVPDYQTETSVEVTGQKKGPALRRPLMRSRPPAGYSVGSTGKCRWV